MVSFPVFRVLNGWMKGRKKITSLAYKLYVTWISKEE
jgi:hypothetical protein